MIFICEIQFLTFKMRVYIYPEFFKCLFMRIFYLIALSIVFGSCTITKRVHNPGWHVEWKSNHSSDKDRGSVAADQSLLVGQTPKESLPEQQQEEAFVTSENPNIVGNTILTDEQDEQALTSTNSEIESRKSSKFDEDKGRATYENEDPGAKKVHPLAKAALISLILSVVTFGLGMLVAIILARYALKKIKSDPEQWTGRKMALTVLIISSVLFIPLMLLIMLISISINYSSGGWL